MGVAFPREIREYLKLMQVNTGIVWQRDGQAGIVVKLPATVDFPSLTITAGPLQKGKHPSPGYCFPMQLQREWYRTTVSCFINPSPLLDTSLVPILCSAKQVEVYAVNAELGYLGVQTFPWSAKKRRNMIAYVEGAHLPKKQQVFAEAEPSPLTKREVSPLLVAYRRTLQQEHVRQDALQKMVADDTTVRGETLFDFQLSSLHEIGLVTRQVQRFAQLIERQIAPTIYFPNHPIWLVCSVRLAGYWRDSFGVLGLRADYEEHPFVMRGGQAYYKHYSNVSPWRLDFVDADGHAFLRLRSQGGSLSPTHWVVDKEHACPEKMCRMPAVSNRELCVACQREESFWIHASNALLVAALNLSLPSLSHASRQFASAVPSLEVSASDSLMPVSLPARVPTRSLSPVPPQVVPPSPAEPERKPVIVSLALLIDRYMREQKTASQQDTALHARKYLWMHSAWIMTEALRHTSEEDELLRIPTDHVYIELEQPRQVYEALQFAACSFFRVSDEWYGQQRWKYDLITQEGKTNWSQFYEYDSWTRKGQWTMPKDFTCPRQQCTIEETPTGKVYQLCKTCQEHVSYVTSWLTIALRMIAGDFQEEVQLKEPEEILETSTYSLLDEQNGAMREKTILHRFRIIQYYDACRYRGTEPRTKRGSWMTGKILAESEYEVDPHAIIYVQIQPRDHDRTYRDDRYIHMKGKTQHIDPKPRLQPMTIATFRQLPKIQHMTRVYASKYAG